MQNQFEEFLVKIVSGLQAEPELYSQLGVSILFDLEEKTNSFGIMANNHQLKVEHPVRSSYFDVRLRLSTPELLRVWNDDIAWAASLGPEQVTGDTLSLSKFQLLRRYLVGILETIA